MDSMENKDQSTQKLRPTDKVYAAFFKAYYEFPDLVKKDKGQFKYLKLGNMMDAIEPALQNNNLIIHHEKNIHEDGRVSLKTYLIEITSQQYISTQDWLILETGGKRSLLQENGAATSYQKRYNIMDLLNLTPEDDNDNDGAYTSTKMYTKQNDNYLATEGQVKYIRTLLKDHQIEEAAACKKLGVTTLEGISKATASEMIEKMRA